MATATEISTGITTDDLESKDQPKAVDSSSSTKPNSYQSASSALPRPLHRSSTVPLFPSSSSTTTSPRPSRDPSPIRPSPRSSTFAVPRGSRSRKNSQELSPNRPPTSNIPAVPSAAAIQRALSAAGTPQLQSSSNSDPSFDATRSQKPAKGLGGGSNHLGLNLPRVKSPPPSASSSKSSIYSPRNKYDQSSFTPSIILEHPTPVTESNTGIDEADEGIFVVSGMRTPVRGPSVSAPTLETVQESIVPSTPSIGAPKSHHGGKGGSDDRPESIAEDSMEEHLAKGTKTRHESGSESGGNKSTATSKESKEVRRLGNSTKPQIMHPKKSITQLHPTKTKSISEGTTKNMTVETETVSTIPQVALGGGAVERTASGRAETGGSLRLKPSNETIRPRKEKKKVVRKAPSISSGTGRTASSKADIFEAKVASAVDEVNSSDSDETFVYESNPPEPLARPHRFHSRTPSATSMASQMDQYGGKGRQDGYHSIAGKKSMKFSNNSYHTAGYPSESNGGTVRGPSQGARPAGHHIGRYGRGGHTSLFDTESPFINTTRPLRTAANNVGRLSSRPSSPRSPNFVRISANPMKLSEPCQSYDLEGEEADNERTPLVGSVRSSRHRYARRPVSGTSRNSYSAGERGHPLCRRITAFLSLGVLLAVLIAAIVIILILCSQPLYDVHVKDIRNVLASEQEIMLDINVHAVNPNLIALQVSDLDVNIFAKSKHVGTNALWRSQQRKSGLGREGLPMESEVFLREEQQIKPSKPYHSQETVDEGTDPIEDPETDSQTMLLGRIFEFDSPLIFDPSPIRHRSLSSIGEVRLAKPGNQTEEGGTGRWEKVIQHDFELIVRGVLRYSLPITSKVRSASIAGRVLVHPGGGEERMDSTVTTGPSYSHTLKRSLLRKPSKFRVNFTR